MSNDKILEIVDRMRRSSDRVKNAGNIKLHQMGIRVSESILQRMELPYAVLWESKFNDACTREYSNKFPQGIVNESSDILNTAGSDGYGSGIPASFDDGKSISSLADKVASDYNDRDVNYKEGGDASTGGDSSDCSHFVNDVLNQAGFDVSYATAQKGAGWIGSSPDFREITDVSKVQPGDVVVQNDNHMGIVQSIDNGVIMGTQMGKHGAQTGSWGSKPAPGEKSSWFPGNLTFYRPQKKHG